ncbi:glycerol-3-phosphate dehydrogenase (NAD(P)+) [bacterium A37T11]|nr:glycerol-3-phosphate dehydrogenase (NAD(P)+) [bacterium A37T11]
MEEQKLRVAVIGGGSWATALIKILTDNPVKKEIYWWMRNADAILSIRQHHHNPHYLSSVEVKIPPKRVSDNMTAIIAKANIIVLCVPAAFLKEVLRGISPEMLKGKCVVSAIKGIIPDQNQIIGEFLQSKFKVPLTSIAVIGGPCHAEEVSLEKLSYLTIASQAVEVAGLVAGILENRYVKANISDDIYGTEYAAVLKNIYAVASGICHGVGYGDNFQAVLISNAIQEMAAFVSAVHPIKRDINESAYLGDLLVTAYSQFSRNRTFGNMVGKGYSVTSAQLEMNMVAEGYYASYGIEQIRKKYRIHTPICEAVYAILYEKQSPLVRMALLAGKLS